MNKRSNVHRVFGSNNGRHGTRQVEVRLRDSKSGQLHGLANSKPVIVSRYSTSQKVFVGPSVDGADVEFVEVARGKVSDRKPSFAR